MSRAWVALVLVVLLGAAGCGSDEPSASPPPSPSPTASTSAAPTPPPLPAAAKKDTKAGAIAFVRHYVALINYAQATGDVEALSSASSDECVSCAKAVRGVAQLYKGGGHLQGGRWNVTATLADRSQHDWLVTVRVKIGPQKVVRPGKPADRLAGGDHTYNFTVQLADARQVTRWTEAS